MRIDREENEMATQAVTPENRFLAAASGGRNCFLTGMAGTGKSTLLKQFIGQSFRKVDVTAPTGVARSEEHRSELQSR